MNAKKILLGGFIGGIVLLVVSLTVSALVQVVVPYDIFALGDMRPVDDPLMLLFFASPFVLSFAGAIVFDLVKDALQGSPGGKGAVFGVILFLIYTVPNVFIVYTSMTYPAGFYLENILFGVIGFPLIGVMYAMFWERP